MPIPLTVVEEKTEATEDPKIIIIWLGLCASWWKLRGGGGGKQQCICDYTVTATPWKWEVQLTHILCTPYRSSFSLPYMRKGVTTACVCRYVRSREYWNIYRGPGFLAVAWFGSSPTPLSLVSVSSTVLVVLNKLVKTFGKKFNLKCGLIRTRQLR